MLSSLECVILLLSRARADAVGEVFHVENERGDVRTDPQSLIGTEGSIEALNFFPGKKTEMIDNGSSTRHEGFISTMESREENMFHLSDDSNGPINQRRKPDFEGGVVNHSTAPEFATVGVCVGKTGEEEAVLSINFFKVSGGEGVREGVSLRDDGGNGFSNDGNRDSFVGMVVSVEDETVFNEKVGLFGGVGHNRFAGRGGKKGYLRGAKLFSKGAKRISPRNGDSRNL